jgi:hypothetical protein
VLKLKLRRGRCESHFLSGCLIHQLVNTRWTFSNDRAVKSGAIERMSVHILDQGECFG